MTIYKIQVEEKHIEDGIPECSTGCAVAQAIDEKLSNLFHLDLLPHIVDAGHSYNLRLTDNKPSVYQTTFDGYILNEDQQKVNNFVKDFDEGKDVLPFDFNIRIHDKSVEKMIALANQEKENFKITK
tara:strand:- start:44 stop:424 length:381 start_codon:yes stop_codon:yes gene_type:complete